MRIFKRHLRRLIAIILATAFAVSAVSLCFPLSASETDGTSPPLSSDSILRDYVDGDELDSAGYKARLIGLEDDNTYVFDNGDGTHTVYMMYEDLKYTDSSGKVREKDLSLVRKSGGYSIASSNIGLYMPDAPKNGINMSYAGRSLTITPMNTGDCDALTDRGAVVYPGAFGEGTFLRYTPLLSGIKEDVILSGYTERAQFTFLVESESLELFGNDDDGYYLAEAGVNSPAFRLGDVVVYDAVGKPDGGSMEIVTLAKGRYEITISANDEFLSDPDTVYPVTVDPTVTVSDKVQGASSIEDAPVFELQPNRNCGTYLYNSVGTTSASYGVGRTAVRLGGLLNLDIYPSLTADQITSVSFHAKDASGSGSQFINLYPLVGNTTWTESNVTWNNVGSYSVAKNYGASMRTGQWTTFDITDLVKAWKNGTYPAQAGFILINENETNNKCFYSSESASDDNKPYVKFTYTYIDFDNATTLELNQRTTLTLSERGDNRCFKFTARESGFYTFESWLMHENCDPKAWLFNEAREPLASDDNSRGTANFRLTYFLVAGSTYYFDAGTANGQPATYATELSSTEYIAYVSAISVPWSDSLIAYCEKQQQNICYKFTPDVSGEYLFTSYNRMGDPRAWIYDSSFGLLASNDDDAGDKNFRLSVNLTAGQDYYIVVGHFGANVGNFSLRKLIAENVSDGIYYIRTKSDLFMDIDGPTAQEFVHQWKYHGSPQIKWQIEKQSDGFYTIRSQYGAKKYVGISSSEIGVNNIKLYSGISDSVKWKIYKVSDNDLVLEPKIAIGKQLCSPNESIDTELQLYRLGFYILYTVKLFEVKYSYEVKHYYDQGFALRFENPAAKIEDYQRVCGMALLEVFGVSTSYSIQSYTSYADNLAQGTLTLDDINERTDAKTSDMLNSDLVSQFGNGTDTMTRVAWTGHMTGTTIYDLLSSSYDRSHSVVLLLGYVVDSNGNNYSPTAVKKGSVRGLLHELSHQLGAPDHYCYGNENNGPNDKCDNPTRDCYKCDYGSDNEPYCIMSYFAPDAVYEVSKGNSLNIYCYNCSGWGSKGIFSHLEDHH